MIFIKLVKIYQCQFLFILANDGYVQNEKYWLPWLVGMPAETTRAICSLIFGGIFDKFPKLKIAFAWWR